MSTWRTRTRNRALAGLCLGLFLLAVSPVCVCAFDGIVTPRNAKRGTALADQARQADEQEQVGSPGSAGEAPQTAVQTGGGEDSASGSPARTAAGTAVLVGAGAYTYMRGRWKEKEKEHTESEGERYVYFENHTRAEGGNEERPGVKM